jgi:hypothetical protein
VVDDAEAVATYALGAGADHFLQAVGLEVTGVGPGCNELGRGQCGLVRRALPAEALRADVTAVGAVGADVAAYEGAVLSIHRRLTVDCYP